MYNRHFSNSHVEHINGTVLADQPFWPKITQKEKERINDLRARAGKPPVDWKELAFRKRLRMCQHSRGSKRPITLAPLRAPRLDI